MTKITLVSLSLALALYGCSNEQEQTTTANTVTAEISQSQPEQSMTQEEASKKLNEIFEQQFQASLELNPIQATAIGVPGYNDKLPNFLSPEFRKKSHDFTVEWLDKVKQIDRNLLTGQDRLSYDIYVYQSEHSLKGEQFPGHLIPINQSSNIANF